MKKQKEIKRKVYNQSGDFLGVLKCNTKDFITVYNKLGWSFDVKMERIKFNGYDLIVMDR